MYAHDASLATDFGLILMRPGKKNRIAEAARQKSFAERLGMPILGEITAPGSTEAGDIVWLDAKTLLIGHGTVRTLPASSRCDRCWSRRESK